MVVYKWRQRILLDRGGNWNLSHVRTNCVRIKILQNILYDRNFLVLNLLLSNVISNLYNGSNNSPEERIVKSRFFVQGKMRSRGYVYTWFLCHPVAGVCCGSLIKSNSWSIFFQAHYYECPAWKQVATTCCVNCVTRKRAYHANIVESFSTVV